MENQARRCCLAILAISICCVCLSSCTEQEFPEFKSIDSFTNTRQDTTHHSIEKRPTVLLNRLMYALQNAIQPSGDGILERKNQMELERRGSPKNYWKCYFNAVTCFRRKRQASSRNSRL